MNSQSQPSIKECGQLFSQPSKIKVNFKFSSDTYIWCIPDQCLKRGKTYPPVCVGTLVSMRITEILTKTARFSWGSVWGYEKDT